MSGNAAKLGPFTGGLNNKSQTGEAKADELVELVNMEVTTDDTLTSRPPIELIKSTVRSFTGATIPWRILCVFRSSPTSWYLIVSEPANNGGSPVVKVNAYLNGDLTTTPIQVEAVTSPENAVADAVQFADEVYFIRDISSSMTGFKWGPSVPYETIASMPRGRVIVSWKSRLWIAGRTDNSGLGAQLRYSDIDPTGPQPDSWDVANYVDIAYGEGGFITSIIPLQNNLVIFKSDGTWRFSYPSQVKDGSVDVLSSSIGAASRYSAVELENVIYLYDQGTVYEMVNSNFTKINDVLDLRIDNESVNSPVADVDMSLVNRRIVIRYSNAIYSLNLDTKSWSQWRSSTGVPGRFVEIPAESSISSSPVYLSASCGTSITEELFITNLDSISSKYGTETKSPEGVLYLPENEVVQLSSPFEDGNSTPQSFNIPVAIGHEIQVSYVAGLGAPAVALEVLDSEGVINTLTTPPVIVDSVHSFTFKLSSLTSPTGAPLVAARVYLESSHNETVAVSSLIVKRNPGIASSMILRLEDTYSDSSSGKELIICRAKTRGVDFGSPQTWKRLYWWGLDIKTYFDTIAVAIPSTKESKVYWGEIDKYSNSQLLKGTYRNPLSWLQRSVSVFNVHEPELDLSEDGRFFKKLSKALRFQRISFEYETKTHGTASTGPAKLFSITPMVKDKRVVIDTNT